MNLYAKWKGEDRDIYLDFGSDLMENITITAEYGKTLRQCYTDGMFDKDYSSPSVVKKSGHTFTGWTYEGAPFDFNSTIITDAITLTATYEPNLYNVFYFDEPTMDTSDYIDTEEVRQVISAETAQKVR